LSQAALANPPEIKLPEGYRLRIYTDADKAGYLGLMHGVGFTKFTPEFIREMQQSILPDGFFVVEHEATGKLAASAMALHNLNPEQPPGGEVGWVAVDAAHRRQGLGRAVCAVVIRRFIQAGYPRIYLSTGNQRIGALALYLQLGFIPWVSADEELPCWEAVCRQLNWPYTPDAWPRWVAPEPRKAAASARKKPIRVGVIGVGRGMDIARQASAETGLKLVALCDTWEERLAEAGKQYGVTTYTDYDRFLEHDMDAVVLANYFHQHAPFAIKALQAGKHVMSETACNTTLAEGVALCRAVEQSGKIYMLAENYPYTKFNQEMHRVYQAGEIGRVLYAEGEYSHPGPAADALAISPGKHHWRNWLPPSYYCTHALAPLVYITETLPAAVNALAVADRAYMDEFAYHGDRLSVILCRMTNGAVFRLVIGGMAGHSIWYRVHGTAGAMELTRGPGYFGPQQVRVWHEPWDLQPNQVTDRVYTPEWPEYKELAARAGHGGGDFWTSFHFANAIRSGVQPILDVYKGVAMSSVGILAWKSCLQDGAPFAMPDFKDETARQAHENDTWSPWPEYAGPGQPPPSILGFVELSAESQARAREVWQSVGYTGE
ncbi:MAG: GNAT family N-acetyltransferase, partial [Anaerolineae bacterium]